MRLKAYGSLVLPMAYGVGLMAPCIGLWAYVNKGLWALFTLGFIFIL